MSVGQVRQLITNGKNHISLIKEGDQTFHLRLGAKGKQLLSGFLNKFVVISRGKESQKSLFTSHKDKDRVIARETFDRQLNVILTKASTQLEKHLRTHSFRATFVIDLLQFTPIEHVRQLVGHKDISSTLEYKRNTLQPRQVDRILKKRRLPSTKSHQKKKRYAC